jgi:hypothetical protein
MPRYVIERSFPNGLHIPANADGAKACLDVMSRNSERNVNWVHSYISKDKSKSFCIYDAPSPEAIRAAADQNALPVDHITEVRVFDPYFYF